jgi:hypothetical protein
MIPAHLPWVVKDVENSQATFCIEIPTAELDDVYDGTESEAVSEIHVDTHSVATSIHEVGVMLDDDEDDEVPDDLFDELVCAKKRRRPLRVYFRCNKGSPEKALWIRAFSRIGRFSNQVRQKKSLLVALTSPLYLGPSRVRTRNQEHAGFARATRELDREDTEVDVNGSVSGTNFTEHIEGMVRGRKTSQDKEYKVLPHYAYPHRWLTREEMREEMMLPSSHFQDLRLPDTQEKEIGSLRVEVLECVGLPKLDRLSETDAVAYLVCGRYAFTTDVIANRSNPMWLRYAKRACVFPIFHAYARLYAGVFDDDGNRDKDDFAGRVVVNIARLRAGSAYDVTLPLRLSTHAFSRKQRGAVRLRFTLHWKNERVALLTYIPKKINIPLPQHSKPRLDMTVACGDPKAFRNIALTIHGSHMPGRFTFPKVKAVIREMNFTRKNVTVAMRQEVFDIREWRTPSVSAYVFMAWMHCLYANSFSLVPAYTVFYFVLLLMRTYAMYGIDGPSQRGFLPPSWEEMFLALVKGANSKEGAIKPLNMVMRSLASTRRDSDEFLTPSFLEEAVDYKVSTHVPWFKWLLRGLGFMPEAAEEDVDLDDYHLEFPYADGKTYPKFRVKECLADRKDDKEHEALVGSSDIRSDSLRMTRDNNGDIRLIPRFDMDFDLMRKDSGGLRDYDDEEKNFATRHAFRHTRKQASKGIRRGANNLSDATGLSSGFKQVVSPIRAGLESIMDRPAGVRRQRSGGSASDSSDFPHELEFQDTTEHADTTGRSVHSGSSLANTVHPGTDEALSSWPDQDIDQNGPSTNKKLTDDLVENLDKMHELTWHLFDDHVYTVKDKSEEAFFFGDAKKPDKRRKHNVPKQLNKLLQVEQYSNNNPFVARLGLYVEPIVESALSFLCFFRAIFSALTWQDPLLTFWISFFLSLLAAILFIFPWRIFLFLVGGFLVGPQNYVIRKLRERGHLAPRKMAVKAAATTPVEDGPVAYSHVGLHGILGPRPRVEADAREVQHVVVPYGPLMYQRFYDWPPEPQYAQVRVSEQGGLAKPGHLRSKSTSIGSVGGGSTHHQAAWRNFRRRFHKRSASMEQPPKFARARMHTGDWSELLPHVGSYSPSSTISVSSKKEA